MKRTTYLALIALAASFCIASAASAEQQYGTLTGTFTFKGTAPAMKKLAVPAGIAGCGAKPSLDESLVIDKNGGIRDVVIYVLGDPKDFSKAVKPIHPDYDKFKTAKIPFDNASCTFSPHIQKLWTSQTLVFKNSDKVSHNTFGSPFENKEFNNLIPANSHLGQPMPLPEKIPFSIACTIHPWMKGFIMVRPDPYVDISVADGSFTIANIPVGTYKFQLWSEGLGYLKKITINGKPSLDRKGLHSFTVKAGKNDLGPIVIDAKHYKKRLARFKP